MSMSASRDAETDRQANLARQGDIAREVWEGYQNETRRQELSHWRGVGKYADDSRWLDIGRKTVATLDAISRYAGRPWYNEGRPLNVLEWGPGGGANAHALGRRATNYYGVDISEPNLVEAARMLKAEHIESFRPVHLTDRIDAVRSMVTEPINVFLSTAVFQHFPSKDYAVGVLEEMRTVCAQDALGFIQIRYEDGRFRGVTNVEDYEKNFVTATSFEVGDFAKYCRITGFQILFMCDINENVNYLTFCLRAVR